MKKEVIVKLHSEFETLVQINPETQTEFWLTRDLQTVLDYLRSENFAKEIDKAKVSCKTSEHNPADPILDLTKMVDLGSGAQRVTGDALLKFVDQKPFPTLANLDLSNPNPRAVLGQALHKSFTKAEPLLAEIIQGLEVKE